MVCRGGCRPFAGALAAPERTKLLARDEEGARCQRGELLFQERRFCELLSHNSHTYVVDILCVVFRSGGAGTCHCKRILKSTKGFNY